MTVNPVCLQSTLNDPDENESIYRQRSVDDVGCFKYFLDDRVQILFSNGFRVEMTPEQVHFCQVVDPTALSSRSISTSAASSIPTRTFDVESQTDESKPRSTYSMVHHRRIATSSTLTAEVGSQATLSSRYITATMDWCLWIWDEKRREDQHNLSANIQEELFRLKLYRNRMEISDYQQSPILTSTVTHSTDYYSPDDIRQILDRTARFTGTSS